MICFYHTDLDGKCAAAIVNLFDFSNDRSFVPVNYNMQIPLDKVGPGERVYIVDFSFEPDVFRKLLRITDNVVWIDHHRTSIEKSACDDIIRGLAGIRSVEMSGCELTWKYFRPNEEIPDAVQLIGDRDTWKWKFGDKTKYFNAGLYGEANSPTSVIWYELIQLNDKSSHLEIERICGLGEVIEGYREQWFGGYRKAWSFEVPFKLPDGREVKMMCMNLATVGSEAFGLVDPAEHPILCLFIYDGKQYVVSLYSTAGPDSEYSIDVGRIAESYGGGGHPAAAGFQCKEMPFLSREQRVESGEHNDLMDQAQLDNCLFDALHSKAGESDIWAPLIISGVNDVTLFCAISSSFFNSLGCGITNQIVWSSKTYTATNDGILHIVFSCPLGCLWDDDLVKRVRDLMDIPYIDDPKAEVESLKCRPSETLEGAGCVAADN